MIQFIIYFRFGAAFKYGTVSLWLELSGEESGAGLVLETSPAEEIVDERQSVGQDEGLQRDHFQEAPPLHNSSSKYVRTCYEKLKF
jgi:hypothetical protein